MEKIWHAGGGKTKHYQTGPTGRTDRTGDQSKSAAKKEKKPHRCTQKTHIHKQKHTHMEKDCAAYSDSEQLASCTVKAEHIDVALDAKICSRFLFALSFSSAPLLK